MTALKEAPIITLEEFEKHDKVNDCWIQIEDMIFDVSEFMHTHPGGLKVLFSLGGRDATFPFQMNHNKTIWLKYLNPLFLGYLESTHVPKIYKDKKYSPVPQLSMKGYKLPNYNDDNSEDINNNNDNDNNNNNKLKLSEKDSLLLADYRKLWKKLDMEGYFITNYFYYYRKIIVYIFIFFGSILAFHLSNVTDSILLGIAASFGLGMFWQQTAFIGHDLGHNAITHSNFYDCASGLLIGNFLGGISLGWWKHTHNVHHIRTNDVVFDPDIQHLPVFAVTQKYLNNVYSMFHDRIMAYDFFAKFFIKNQHWLFIPICLIARLNLNLQSFIYIIWTMSKTPKTKFALGKHHKILEIIALIGYFCWSYPLFYNSKSPFLFWFITHVVAGILHIQLIINHFPCPTFEDLHPNFFIHQWQTTVDIKSNRYTDWFLGGLQFQLEHHLFPNLPRHNLKKIKPFVEELCSKYDLKYPQATFFDAVYQTFKTLEKVANSAKAEFHIHTF